ncbi:MAG: 50S ribosomal protein L4 [Helicobacter sp.]|nr:50S ribosomal protein L4 [Helicobacter sp.]
MNSVKVLSGENSGEFALPESFSTIKEHNLYLYVKFYMAHLRSNNANVKTRGLVRGGGKKPWNQKGGGRARAGSLTSPVFVGGGVSHGPSNNKNYNLKINKKQKKLALQFALDQKAAKGKFYLVDSINIESGKTKDALAFFNQFGEKNVLFVSAECSDPTYLALRNLRNCYIIEAHELNAYLAATFGAIVMEKQAFNQILDLEKLEKEV